LRATVARLRATVGPFPVALHRHRGPHKRSAGSEHTAAEWAAKAAHSTVHHDAFE